MCSWPDTSPQQADETPRQLQARSMIVYVRATRDVRQAAAASRDPTAPRIHSTTQNGPTHLSICCQRQYFIYLERATNKSHSPGRSSRCQPRNPPWLMDAGCRLQIHFAARLLRSSSYHGKRLVVEAESSLGQPQFAVFGALLR